MDKYTIYCTAEQTKKAFKLGAPINVSSLVTGQYGEPHAEYITYLNPTAEQMIGWLEEHGFVIEIILSDEEEHPWTFAMNKVKDVCVYDTRKEATLAAIDAALEYLKSRIIK